MRRDGVHKKILLFLLVFLLFLSLPIHPTVQSATVRYVSNDFNFENTNETEWQITKFNSINDAIDAADIGDTIYIYNGTYNEAVTIEKTVTITGESKEITIITRMGIGHTIEALGTDGSPISPQITQLTVQGPSGEGYDCIALDYVENGLISNCLLQNSPSGDGIQLSHSTNNTIQDNTILNNDRYGIHLTQSSYNTLRNNNIQGNQKGIYIYQTTSGSDNIITENTISGNSQVGIQIQQSPNNLIYLNDLTSNGENALDNTETSQWYFESQGNYWDDYTGYDDDEDNIGDTPYPIPGGDRYDYYPLGYFQEHSSTPGNMAPTAYSPTITPNPAQYGELVSFSGSGSDNDGSITSFRWSSNLDGTISSQQSFTTDTLSVGTHTISFKVQDNDGAWSSEKTKELVIEEPSNIAPTATILSITPNPAIVSTEISFQATSTDTDGYIVGWKWLSNIDAQISTQQNFTTDDLSVGTHTIYFQVQDNEGNWSDYDTATLVIEEEDTNLAPIAKIVATTNGAPNQPHSFDATSSTDPNTDDELSYLWNFGDNTTSTAPQPTHLYTAAGNYTVTLTVTDDLGESNTTSTIIRISSASSGSTSNETQTNVFEDFEIPLPALIIIPIIFIGIIIVLFLKKA